MMEQYQIDHIAAVRRMAPECMVLLKADGSFPLEKPQPIALYGSGARRTLKGGRGSGDVNVEAFPSVEQGLENAGCTVTTKAWLDAYEQAYAEGEAAFRAWLKPKIEQGGMDRLIENLSIVMPEPDYELPLDGEGNAAVYVLSRQCGEGVDRQAVPGDLFLSKTEIRDILTLQKKYPKFLLVLNTACYVDVSPVAAYLGNILQMSQPGITVGDSFADVLLGKTYPSGKLAATWAAWNDYEKIGEFGNKADTRYREGIYVGYRWFDTVGTQPMFPFGFGLGYTTFLLTAGQTNVEKTVVSVPVTVQNTGAFAGKEVVQLYVSLPQGTLDQPYQVLTGFAKTKELRPGERDTVTVSFDMAELVSYDTITQTRILAQGEYLLRVGNSSRNTQLITKLVLERSVVLEKVTPIAGETDFADWQPERKVESADCAALALDADAFVIKTYTCPPPSADALQLVGSMTAEELCYLCTGEFKNEGSKQVIGDSALTVVGAAGETSGRFAHLGVPSIIMADGPAGLRLSRVCVKDEEGAFPVASGNNLDTLELLTPQMREALTEMIAGIEQEEHTGEVFYQNCTAVPVATAIAQSWNTALAEECGDLVRAEMERFHVDVWLAPALNIQRNALCGRNFEYYSEDPLLSGKMAAAVTRGVQHDGHHSVMIKHFICNNQETNRFRSNSMVSERAVRDLYCRGFEIAVKDSAPMGVMTSYNLLNGVHTCENKALLETMLRGEWGFAGVITSDYLNGDATPLDGSNKYRKFFAVPSMEAGLDLVMPGGKAHYEQMLAALKDGTLSRSVMEQHAARMIDYAWTLRGKINRER